MPDKFSLSGIDVDMTRFNSLTNAERIQLLSDFSDRFGLALEKDGFALTKIAFRKDRRMMFAISLITIVRCPHHFGSGNIFTKTRTLGIPSCLTHRNPLFNSVSRRWLIPSFQHHTIRKGIARVSIALRLNLFHALSRTS